MTPPIGQERLCDKCGGAIEPGRYHSVNGQVLDDHCALHAAVLVLDALQEKNHAEINALDVVRQLAREHLAGHWQRRKP